ncbi:MAG: glycosyltransferase [candidate division Zixibacteria bacterium]|nr:glycosyltransferase [candidate division Zixibacteria bacterium]
MKILIIDEEFPYPLNSGKRIRTFNLVKGLEKFNQISYMAYGTEKSDSYEFLKSNNINPIAVGTLNRKQSGLRFYLRLLGNLFSPYPYIVTSHYSNRFQYRLIALLKNNKYDVIICEWSPYAIFIKKLNQFKSIIVAHNIEASIWRRYQENETNIFKKIYISIQRKKIEEFERSCFNWANGATAVSATEADEIASYGASYIPAVIDNGVDTEYFSSGESEINANHLVMTGAMDWRPNQDAAIYFTEEILPIIKKTKPDCTVSFVGRNPSKHVLDLAQNESVAVSGTVDDVRPYISNANVFIVPLRIGGGSRLKILEAFSMNKAVVSTSVGAEGLNVTNGENILLADSPRQFAQAIIDCIDNNELNTKLSNNGKKLVESKYRWDILSNKFNNYILKIVDDK